MPNPLKGNMEDDERERLCGKALFDDVKSTYFWKNLVPFMEHAALISEKFNAQHFFCCLEPNLCLLHNVRSTYFSLYTALPFNSAFSTR
jgi:hypothetical protein